jgi:hypothetical protein
VSTRSTSGEIVNSATSADATYVYCVVNCADRDGRAGGSSARASTLGRIPKGLLGTGRPRILDAGDGYRLVVGSAPLSRYGAAAVEAKLGDLDWLAARAREHEEVVEHVTKLGSVVPMKLFTLFRNDERALNHVYKMKRSLGRVVDRIAGCEEWALRILFDPTRRAHAGTHGARSKSHGSASRRKEVEGPGRSNEAVSGTSFLRRKKALVEERSQAGARGAAIIEELYECLANTVRDADRRTAAEGEIAAGQVLDAVFLVPRESVKKVKAIVATSATSLVDDGFYVALSGPWPAYSFIGDR